jgi:protein SCO1
MALNPPKPSTAPIWGILIIALGGLMVAMGWKAYGDWMNRMLPVIGTIPEFELVNKGGAQFGKKDLEGKIWIANFIFTRCAGPCPVQSYQLSSIQERLLRERHDIKLISFTVDPGYDTPAVLTEYASRYEKAPGQWHWLTGNEDQIMNLAREHFKVTAEPGLPTPENPHAIMHSTHFILVDGKGNIRGYYSSGENASLDKVASDARRLLGTQQFLPALNAGLNLTSTFLLVLGYVAIRQKKYAIHRRYMYAAIVCSAVFLCSYLLYHFGVQLTKPYEGPGREIYLIILFSHIVLAIFVLPLILLALSHALRAQRDDPHLRNPEMSTRFSRHRWIARIAFPIWLYVSITGVIVYVVLYQLPRWLPITSAGG